jgi:MFS family permease
VSDHRAESITVNAAGLVQGIALVTFPAASGIFTSHADYNLTSSQYGLMFTPQVVTAIIASLLSAGLLWPGFTARVSEKETYLAGLVADLAAMALLMASWTVAHQHAAAYALLLAATACLGAGFGFAVPSLNTLTAALHPGATDRSVLVLNALLGLGTALAPAFVAVFNGIGFWVGLPLLAAVLLAGLIAVSLRLPLRPGQTEQQPDRGNARLPLAFWLFGAFAFLYGICETMNGNWSQLELTSLGVSSSTASLALTGFWALVTIGRVLLAVVQRWLPSRAAYHGLPFVLAAAFVLIAALPHHAPGAAVAAFCLAGLGCSALLPLTISFGQEKLAAFQAEVAGGVIACYQAGYGVAAFGVGPLLSVGVRLPAIFAGSAVVAAVMGAFSFVVARGRPSPATVHPRPALPRARALQQSTSLRDRVVPAFPCWQERRRVGPPRAPRVRHHRAHVAEHRIHDGPGCLYRVLIGEQPALPAQRGADQPVVRAQVLAGEFAEREFLRQRLPLHPRLLADEGQHCLALRVDPEPDPVRRGRVAEAERVVRRPHELH